MGARNLKTMQVLCVDVTSPRSDNKPGNAQSITPGKIYPVAEILDSQYSIINDKGKMARYSQYRFQVVEDRPVPDLRDHYNMLTLPLRERIKELEEQLAVV